MSPNMSCSNSLFYFFAFYNHYNTDPIKNYRPSVVFLIFCGLLIKEQATPDPRLILLFPFPERLKTEELAAKIDKFFFLFSLMPLSVTMAKAPTNIFIVQTLNVFYWNDTCKQTLCLKVQWQMFMLQLFALSEFPDRKYAIKYSLFYR